MTTLETAEGLVSKLSPRELLEFRRWFAQFDGEAWDKQIESDAAAGRLDRLADEALAEYHAGIAAIEVAYGSANTSGLQAARRHH